MKLMLLSIAAVFSIGSWAQDSCPTRTEVPSLLPPEFKALKRDPFYYLQEGTMHGDVQVSSTDGIEAIEVQVCSGRRDRCNPLKKNSKSESRYLENSKIVEATKTEINRLPCSYDRYCMARVRSNLIGCKATRWRYSFEVLPFRALAPLDTLIIDRGEACTGVDAFEFCHTTSKLLITARGGRGQDARFVYQKCVVKLRDADEDPCPAAEGVAEGKYNARSIQGSRLELEEIEDLCDKDSYCRIRVMLVPADGNIFERSSQWVYSNLLGPV